MNEWMNLGTLEPQPPWDWSVTNALETRSYTVCATILNLVDLHQTVWT